MHRKTLPLLMALAAAAPLFTVTAASAQSVKLQFGMPLGTFTATQSGHSAGQITEKPASKATSKAAYARETQVQRRKPTVAATTEQDTPPVRVQAASQDAPKPVETKAEPPKVETAKEAGAPTAVASQENKTCRKFIATAGTTIEVPCTAAGD